ncbi:hypothetical protein ACT691_15165 [Vibrio metschnikovii]
MGDFNKPLHHEEFQGLMSQALYRKPETQDPLSNYAFYDSWDIYSEATGKCAKRLINAGATGSVARLHSTFRRLFSLINST